MRKPIGLLGGVCLALAAMVALSFPDGHSPSLAEVSPQEADGVAGGQHTGCGRTPELGTFCNGATWCTWWFSVCAEASDRAGTASGDTVDYDVNQCQNSCGDDCGPVYVNTTCF